MTSPNHPNRPRPDGAKPDSAVRHRAYTFPEGTVYATIRPARVDDGHLVARLEITSHSARDGDGADTALTIGGRRYSVTALHQSRSPRVDRLGVFISWRCDGRDRHRGCAPGQGHPVAPHTEAWTRLHDIARSALRRLACDVPGWEHDSVRLHWLRERSGLLDTIRDLNRKLGEADAGLRRVVTALGRANDRDGACDGELSDPTRCVVLFCGGAAERLVHARYKALDFEATEPMCRDHAHRPDGSCDILSAGPVPATPATQTTEMERS